MNLELSTEALEYGEAGRRAFSSMDTERALKELNAFDLDLRGGRDDVEAGAALCRSAGWCAVTDPVADRLVGHVDIDDPLTVVLPGWTLLGMLDRAIDLTCAYVKEREQFGQTLSMFQGVQFQLTDAEVERVALDQLAKYALWSCATGHDDAVVDALALRLAAIEAAEVVFRVCHQLHGAIGFCDETTISWLSRASQPLRRQPLGLSATRAALTKRLGRRGLTGLFSA